MPCPPHFKSRTSNRVSLCAGGYSAKEAWSYSGKHSDITYMRGVDVADQLQASYSSQTRSHKWWHRVFWAMLDVTEVNMYIMYLSRCKEGRNPIRHPMNHLEFKVALCKALLHGWPLRNTIMNEALIHQPSIHMPSHTNVKRICVVYEVRTPHTYCFQCDFKFMCWKEGCYQRFHEGLAQRH
jgi:hypothetical protein